MLCEEYRNFQKLVLKHLGYEQSFSYFKSISLNPKKIDPEIREEIKNINTHPLLCTDYIFGSCYGFHGGEKDFPHVSIYYDDTSRGAQDLVSKIFSRLQSLTGVNLTSEFSRSAWNDDEYYERKIDLNDISGIQHVQIDVEDSYFALSSSEKQNFCERFWRDSIGKTIKNFG